MNHPFAPGDQVTMVRASGMPVWRGRVKKLWFAADKVVVDWEPAKETNFRSKTFAVTHDKIALDQNANV